MYLLIIILPLLGSLISGFGGRWLGCHGSNLLSTICVSFSMFFSFIAFYEVGFGNANCYLVLSNWINSELLSVNWGFLFDSLTVTMLVIITTISTLVHLYSIKYMGTDPHTPRFMAYLEIFTFFMLVLVTADNLIQMFLGWEGVGLASYLLINFWHTRLAANQSAIKALVVNRVGDFGLSLGIFTIFCMFSSVDYLTIFSCAPLLASYDFIFMGLKVHGLTLATCFLFVGAVGKSAQLGLHTWLPDAMEGPTPVSALIHAATMVTAGVFLMVRFSPVLEYCPFTLFILIMFGSLTAFFAAVAGVFQNDLKKVIAYSTCSQLGYMVFACGLSCYHVTMFHLVNHAFFKALLFLGAGSVIHAVSDEQDMRRMGSLAKFLPLTYSLMLIGSLALTGFPFLTGFYSKDFILELAQVTGYGNLYFSCGFFSCWLGSVAVFFTSFYSFRLIYLTFLNNSNVSRPLIKNTHEVSFLMVFPLVVLAVGSLWIGYLTKELFVGFGTNFWGSSIFILPQHSQVLEAEWLPASIKWLPFFTSLSGILTATLINIFSSRFYFVCQYNKIVIFLGFILNKKWYFDKLSNSLVVKPLMNFGYFISFKNIDKGFIELLFPTGAEYVIPKWSKIVAKVQSGQITHYIFFVVFGVLFLCSVLVPSLFFNININPVLSSICLVALFFI